MHFFDLPPSVLGMIVEMTEFQCINCCRTIQSITIENTWMKEWSLILQNSKSRKYLSFQKNYDRIYYMCMRKEYALLRKMLCLLFKSVSIQDVTTLQHIFMAYENFNRNSEFKLSDVQEKVLNGKSATFQKVDKGTIM
jgi:hypothetical protein